MSRGYKKEVRAELRAAWCTAVGLTVLSAFQGFAVGTPDTSGLLRAERSGKGNGRVYTLTYRGMDVAGNSATCSATVTVPHDRGK